MDKKPNRQRNARREGRSFPESNRFWTQIRILLGAQAPLLGSLLHRRRLHLRGRLAAVYNKCRAGFERRRLPAPARIGFDNAPHANHARSLPLRSSMPGGVFPMPRAGEIICKWLENPL